MSSDPKVRRDRQALLLGMIGVVIFGLTMPATRAAVLELDPVFVTLGRALTAAVLAALSLLAVRPEPPRSSDWPRLALFALCSIIGFPLLMSTAMQYAPASHAAVVLAVLPLLTAMAGVFVARERPSLGFWACGIAGTGAVIIYSLLTGSSTSGLHWADLLLAGAALCGATAYALGGEMTHRIGGWEVISWRSSPPRPSFSSCSGFCPFPSTGTPHLRPGPASPMCRCSASSSASSPGTRAWRSAASPASARCSSCNPL